MYTLDNDLTVEKLTQIIQDFQTRCIPKMLHWKNYYNGKQKIVKQGFDSQNGKVDFRVCVNYCRSIVENFRGYLTGVPVSYSCDSDITPLLDIMNFNDEKDETSDLLKDALVYGKSFEAQWVDTSGQIRFKRLSPLECIDVYSSDLDNRLRYVIRLRRINSFVGQDERWEVDVYDDKSIKHYTSSQGFSSFSLIGEEPHFFKDVPFAVLILNDEEESIFNQIISLQDAYNQILSDECSEYSSFCDAYLLLKGMIAEEEDLSDMKQHRVLMMDADSDASYLTKQVSDTQVENILKNINDQIYKRANCVDFEDDKFGVSSGIALRYRLLGFENVAGSIANNLIFALQRRIELINNIATLLDSEVWRDIKIEVNRNLPTDLENTANVVNSLRGLVSTETLLSQIPFVADPQEELKRLEEEKQANLALYDFGGGENNEDDID